MVTDDNVHYTPYTNHTFILDGQNYSYSLLATNFGSLMNGIATGFYDISVPYGGLNVMTPFSYAIGNTLYTSESSNSSSPAEDQAMRQVLTGMFDNMARGLTNWYVSCLMCGERRSICGDS